MVLLPLIKPKTDDLVHHSYAACRLLPLPECLFPVSGPVNCMNPVFCFAFFMYFLDLFHTCIL